MVKVSFWRLLGGLLAGLMIESLLGLLALYGVVLAFQERAFQPGSYQYSDVTDFLLMVLYAAIYAAGTYVAVRVAGTKGFQVLIWVTALIIPTDIFINLQYPPEVSERTGSIDWQNLYWLASSSPPYWYGNLVMMVIGLWLGRKWVKPEHLEFEKVKIESNSNYPRDDYQN
jgi:hypothetical protein